MRDVSEKERGGGAGQKMSKTKREEIALKAVGLSELNHRVPAVQSDSALALNRTRRWPDMDATTEAKMERIKKVSQHKTRERQNAKCAHLAELWFLRDGILSEYELFA